MADAYICDFIRTPIGRFGGSLSSVRTDDLGAIPLKALIERNPNVDFGDVDDVIFGCANQAGKTIATWRACRRFWPDCRKMLPARRSTVCAGRAWMRSSWPHARSNRVKPI